MDESLESLENELGIGVSKEFRGFWDANVPYKTPNFRIVKSTLRQGKFADVGFDPDNGWLIRVREELLYEAAEVEIPLAHEI